MKYTREFWQRHKDDSGEQLGKLLGIDGGSARRLIRQAKADPATADLWSQEDSIEDARRRFKASLDKHADGSYRSNKLLALDDEQLKDQTYLLVAHGFDPDEWDVVTSKNRMWNVASDETGVRTLYSSTITVRPRKVGFTVEDIVEATRAVAIPVEISPRPSESSGGLLEVPFFDLHFGLSTLADYDQTLVRTVEVIGARTRDQIVIPVGSDLFQVDNLKGTTSNGTPQDRHMTVDVPTMWREAGVFYSHIIEAALNHAVVVKVVYVKGNHDESMSWAFVQMLQAMYPQVVFDVDIRERKVHTYEEVALGLTHGDKKNAANLDRAFLSEFPEFAAAKVREIHTAHKHHEVTKDQFGVVVRILPTGNRTDEWHDDNAFIGANKRFMLFEYAPDALQTIHYV